MIVQWRKINQGSVDVGEIAVLYRMIREGLAEKMTFEQRSEGGDGARHTGN